MNKTLRGIVEEACQEAYAIGHAHGSGPWRMLEGKPPLRDDEGWAMPANRLIRQLRRRQQAEDKKERVSDD